MTEFWNKLKEYGTKIWLALAFLLVAILSFEAGLLQKSLQESVPVVVSVPETTAPPSEPVRTNESTKTSTESSVKSSTAASSQTKGNCAFVGSKNSNKYHVPTSRCAKQIKPENLVCFASEDDAKTKQYLPGCLN